MANYTTLQDIVTKQYVDGEWGIETEDVISINGVVKENKTIADCIKTGSFETVKELCEIEGMEIVFVKKESLGKRHLKNSDEFVTEEDYELDCELKG